MAALSMLVGLATFVCAIFILIHAFQASVGQGLLCLCIPFYIFYYALARYQHPNKNLIVGGLFLGFALQIVLGLAGGGMTAFSAG